MFKKLMKNKKAQQTAEYALLISLVVAAIIAMQTYAQRTIQARIRDAAVHMTNGTAELRELGTTQQYEPYYLETSYETTRNETTEQLQDQDGVFNTTELSTRTRGGGGFQRSAYNVTAFGLLNGL